MYKVFGTNCSFSFLRKHNLVFFPHLLCLNHKSALMMTFSKRLESSWTGFWFVAFNFCQLC